MGKKFDSNNPKLIFNKIMLHNYIPSVVLNEYNRTAVSNALPWNTIFFVCVIIEA